LRSAWTVRSNELSHARRIGFCADILQRCRSPLVVQLLIIALISGAIGEIKSALIVSAMVFLSVGLSYILDRRSAIQSRCLEKRVQSRTLVLPRPVRKWKSGYRELCRAISSFCMPAQSFRLTCGCLRKGFLCEPISAHRGVHGGRKNDFQQACLRTPRFGSDQRLLFGKQRHQRHSSRCSSEHGTRTIFGSISERLTERREETSFDKGVRTFTWLMIRFHGGLGLRGFLFVG